VLTPPIAALVHSLGVAGAAPWLAGTYVLGVIPVSVAFLRPDPAARGTWPDGDPAPPPRGHDDGPTTAEALRTGWFWVVTVALMLGMLGQVGALSHLFNAVTERLDAAAGAAAVSTMALASLVGRIIGSWALSRVRLTTATAVLLGLQGLATLGIAAAPSTATVLVCTVAFGLTVGNMQVLHPLLIAERYGIRSYGRILALSGLGVMTGMAVGPFVVGVVRTGTGSYLLALAVAAAAAVMGAALIALLLHGTRHPTPSPTGLPGHN
jgi:hypothetical protein